MIDFLEKTWEGPVLDTFKDTFGEAGQVDQELRSLVWAQMGEITILAGSDLVEYLYNATEESDRTEIAQMLAKEIMLKAVTFCPALTVGEIQDMRRLIGVTVAIALMYWADQTMDRGSDTMLQAVELLDPQKAMARMEILPDIQRIVTSLEGIAEKVAAFAMPQDAPYVLDCYYGQVLLNEAHMRRLSQDYLNTDDQDAFLALHADDIASTMTINAGFPSVASSLYAIYRQENDQLPPLSEVYSDRVMTKTLQTCNAIVRLWDELGDWRMDSGEDPEKGIFTVNLFNQYHPAIIDRFCLLAGIDDPGQKATLQQSFAAFHESDASRQKHGKIIDDVFLGHIRQYMHHIPEETQQKFELYITLCKRVIEIGYVNRIGDIALMGDAE